MVDSKRLIGVIYQNGLSQAKVANMLGITPKTFYEKMKIGVFSSAEIEAMLNLMEIDSPLEVFFNQKVASKVTNSDKKE